MPFSCSPVYCVPGLPGYLAGLAQGKNARMLIKLINSPLAKSSLDGRSPVAPDDLESTTADFLSVDCFSVCFPDIGSYNTKPPKNWGFVRDHAGKSQRGLPFQSSQERNLSTRNSRLGWFVLSPRLKCKLQGLHSFSHCFSRERMDRPQIGNCDLAGAINLNLNSPIILSVAVSLLR